MIVRASNVLLVAAVALLSLLINEKSAGAGQGKTGPAARGEARPLTLGKADGKLSVKQEDGFTRLTIDRGATGNDPFGTGSCIMAARHFEKQPYRTPPLPVRTRPRVVTP